MSTPLAGKDRIEVVDILRGFALIGVLMVNLVDLGTSMFVAGYVRPAWGLLDSLAEGFIFLFGAGKFYLIFSFLFGLGFALQMGRMEGRGQAFVPIYRRRLVILFIIGWILFLFIWRGDILRMYALLGFLLLWWRHLSTRTLLMIAAVSMGLSFLVAWIGAALTLNPTDADLAKETAIFLQPSYLEMVIHRLTTPSETLWLIVQLPSVLAMFMLGLIVGRGDYLQRLETLKPWLKTLAWIALPIGLVGNVVFGWAYEAKEPFIGAIGITIGAPLLSLSYLVAVIFFANRLRPLA